MRGAPPRRSPRADPRDAEHVHSPLDGGAILAQGFAVDVSRRAQSLPHVRVETRPPFALSPPCPSGPAAPSALPPAEVTMCRQGCPLLPADARAAATCTRATWACPPREELSLTRATAGVDASPPRGGATVTAAAAAGMNSVSKTCLAQLCCGRRRRIVVMDRS